MRKIGKMSACFLLVLVAVMTAAIPVLAAEAVVRYEGGAEGFVFLPGDDLFLNFKDVMPGDTLEQTVEIRNTRPGNDTVKIYLRAEKSDGNDADAEDFLSQMELRIYQGDSLIAQGKANGVQPGQDMLLGSFKSGGSTSLRAVLEVPAELDNSFADRAGEVVWVFTAEVVPPSVGPKTGDSLALLPLMVLLVGSLLGMAVLVIDSRLKRK